MSRDFVIGARVRWLTADILQFAKLMVSRFVFTEMKDGLIFIMDIMIIVIVLSSLDSAAYLNLEL